MQIEKSIIGNVEIGEILEIAPVEHLDYVITYKVTGIDDQYIYCEELK